MGSRDITLLNISETCCQTILSKVVLVYAPDGSEGRSNRLYLYQHCLFPIIIL